MAKYVEVEEKDLQILIECIEYVITRYENDDPEMCEYLKEQLSEVLRHVDNETRGGKVASEIDVVLGVIGGHVDGEGERD